MVRRGGSCAKRKGSCLLSKARARLQPEVKATLLLAFQRKFEPLPLFLGSKVWEVGAVLPQVSHSRGSIHWALNNAAPGEGESWRGGKTNKSAI